MMMNEKYVHSFLSNLPSIIFLLLIIQKNYSLIIGLSGFKEHFFTLPFVGRKLLNPKSQKFQTIHSLFQIFVGESKALLVKIK